MKDSYEQDARILIERLCFGSLEWDAEATKRAIHRTTALVEGQRAALKDAQQRIDGLEDLVEHINATNELMKKALTGVLQSAGYESGENSSGHKQMMVSLWALDKAREALSKCEDLDTQLREPSPETREWIESLRRAYLEKYGNDADARTVSFSEWLTRAEVALAERDAMCPTCGGSGQVIRMRPDALLMKMIHVGVPCPTCRG